MASRAKPVSQCLAWDISGVGTVPIRGDGDSEGDKVGGGGFRLGMGIAPFGETGVGAAVALVPGLVTTPRATRGAVIYFRGLDLHDGSPHIAARAVPVVIIS